MAKEVNYVLRKAFESKIEKYRSSVNESDKMLAMQIDEIYKGIQLDEDEFASKCMHLYTIDQEEIDDKFSMYRIQNAVELDKQFDEENNFKTSVRGLKVRGIFNERKEAEDRCKILREELSPLLEAVDEL